MKKNQTSTESEVSLYKLFWTFFLFSMLGYVFEVTVQFLYSGAFENHQGLIYGPFSQIYGLGATVAVLLYPRLHRKSTAFIYAFCVFGGGLFEYVCSLSQEMLFGSTSWNYSWMKFNIHGRTNLLYSLIWGVFGVLIIKYIYPGLSKLLDRLTGRRAALVTWIAFTLMLGNVLITAAAARRQYERYLEIPATNKLQIFLDEKYPDSYLKKLTPEPSFK